jgi:hypothetical protein
MFSDGFAAFAVCRQHSDQVFTNASLSQLLLVLSQFCEVPESLTSLKRMANGKKKLNK